MLPTRFSFWLTTLSVVTFSAPVDAVSNVAAYSDRHSSSSTALINAASIVEETQPQSSKQQNSDLDAEALLSEGFELSNRGDFEGAIARFQQGVAQEDALNYDEPSPWYSPVRQRLGAVLLQANRLSEAEAAFEADLAIYPHNGWSLHGLTQALNAQGKTEAARQTQDEFEIVWQYADVDLS